MGQNTSFYSWTIDLIKLENHCAGDTEGGSRIIPIVSGFFFFLSSYFISSCADALICDGHSPALREPLPLGRMVT